MRVLVILVGERQRSVFDRSDWHPAERFADLYYALRESGCDIVLGSREGGPASWSIPSSDTTGIGASANRLARDRQARDALSETLDLERIVVRDFDTVICLCPGSRAGDVQCTDWPVHVIEAAIGLGKRVAILGLNATLPVSGDGILILPEVNISSSRRSVASLLRRLGLGRPGGGVA